MIKSDNDSWNCPMCGRKQLHDESVCRRCGADLTCYNHAIKNHACLLRQAEAKLKTDPKKARNLAGQASALRKTEDAFRIQALAELCSGNYRKAVERWRMWAELQS